MSFRAKIFLAITVTVVVAVWIVAGVVSTLVARSFERRDEQRTATLVAQFHAEFNRRSAEVARRLDAIASSDEIARMAVDLGSPQADPGKYYDQAQNLAREQSLDFLELVGPDASIISSAEWPARFGYKENWLLSFGDSKDVFLKREELADGAALGLIAVRAVSGQLYIAGGQKLDKQFLDTLPVVEGMRVELRTTIDSTTPSREITRSTPDATITSIPLFGREHQLLAVLLVENSRLELASLKRYIRDTALLVGSGAVLLGLLLSFWTASRVTRPLRELTSSVREVAEGKWDARAAVRSSDEVGQLARDFNRMTAQLVEQRDRMIQAERVAAWRELARRLAHELKNPLFPLQITIENLQRSRDTPQFEEVFRESTTTLLAELDNLKTIVGRFSDFSKMPAPELELTNLNQVVREVIKLFDAQIHAEGRPEAKVELALDENLAAIQADPEQIRRALRNLILNALDAMPAGGVLTVRTQNLDGKVALEISDSGAGLTPEECERLFTPYYTTKQHGTGLGLAIVQSVVSDHKGTITVHSEPGKGATFRIEFKA
ncbi:MAG TPA: ATP-binding protein [Bryobacteraceae bacterium]|nr:ATP-binding protein [Bryobacteraceae bacterium]